MPPAPLLVVLDDAHDATPSGFDLLAALTLALATMTLGVMGGFALIFVPPWIVFRRARSWRSVQKCALF
jgi:zinc transport system permease protein